MGAEKLPLESEIPWDKIRNVRVSKDGQNFSFEFDLNGKKQKMTMSISPNQTSVTLSKDNGTPIVNATQRGGEVTVLDFSTKTATPKWLKTIQKKNQKSS